MYRISWTIFFFTEVIYNLWCNIITAEITNPRGLPAHLHTLIQSRVVSRALAPGRQLKCPVGHLLLPEHFLHSSWRIHKEDRTTSLNAWGSLCICLIFLPSGLSSHSQTCPVHFRSIGVTGSTGISSTISMWKTLQRLENTFSHAEFLFNVLYGWPPVGFHLLPVVQTAALRSYYHRLLRLLFDFIQFTGGQYPFFLELRVGTAFQIWLHQNSSASHRFPIVSIFALPIQSLSTTNNLHFIHRKSLVASGRK